MKGTHFLATAILLGASTQSGAGLATGEPSPPGRTPPASTPAWLKHVDVALSSLVPKARAASTPSDPQLGARRQGTPVSLNGPDTGDAYSPGYNPGNWDTAGWWSSY